MLQWYSSILDFAQTYPSHGDLPNAAAKSPWPILAPSSGTLAPVPSSPQGSTWVSARSRLRDEKNHVPGVKTRYPCYMWVCLKMVSTPLYPMVLLIIIPSWKMAISLGILTQHFQTNPCYNMLRHVTTACLIVKIVKMFQIDSQDLEFWSIPFPFSWNAAESANPPHSLSECLVSLLLLHQGLEVPNSLACP